MTFQNRIQNYLASGWTFRPDEYLLKQRFYLLNMIVALGFLAVAQGVVFDVVHGRYMVLMADIVIFFVFIIGSLFLRKDKKYYDVVTNINAFVSLLFLNFIIVASQFKDMEFIWLFFFVVTFMFLKGPKVGAFWNLALFVSLILIKIQTFYLIDFTYVQIFYLIFALSLVSAMTYSFHKVIDENHETIFKQGQQLEAFNVVLEEKVREQTEALVVLNEGLSETVEKKVTEVHKQQEMLITQSRLAAMGEMLSMIAHQWRQPLSTTTLRISKLQIKSMLEEKGSDERDELLEEVSDTLVYLSDTIDDFQTYFKPDNKKEVVNIASVTERAKGFIRARTDIYKINVVCQGDSEVSIQTYPNELIQVLINILNNAVDVVVSSNPVRKEIAIEVLRSDEDVRILITDSGSGIEEKLLERVFEPYFSTKSENGTGLGLYMAKMIIQEHMSGEISVNNSRDGGAQFTIMLPLDKKST